MVIYGVDISVFLDIGLPSFLWSYMVQMMVHGLLYKVSSPWMVLLMVYDDFMFTDELLLHHGWMAGSRRYPCLILQLVLVNIEYKQL